MKRLTLLISTVVLVCACSGTLPVMTQSRAETSAHAEQITTPEGWTEELFRAVRQDDISRAKEAIKNGADVNAYEKNEAGMTALMNAVFHNNIKMVKLLIAKGADVNAISQDGSITALTLAVVWDPKDVTTENIKMLKLLIAKGANVNAKRISGHTPLLDANFPEAVNLLIAKGANVNAKNDFGQTALMFAAFNGQTKTANLLVKKGADVNAKTFMYFNKQGELYFLGPGENDLIAALNRAIDSNNMKEVTRLLVQIMDGDEDIKDTQEMTVVEIARAKGHEETAKAIEETYKKVQAKKRR